MLKASEFLCTGKFRSRCFPVSFMRSLRVRGKQTPSTWKPDQIQIPSLWMTSQLCGNIISSFLNWKNISESLKISLTETKFNKLNKKWRYRPCQVHAVRRRQNFTVTSFKSLNQMCCTQQNQLIKVSSHIFYEK